MTKKKKKKEEKKKALQLLQLPHLALGTWKLRPPISRTSCQPLSLAAARYP